MSILDQCPRGYVEKLVLDNFKSYAGRHEIGPLKRFSCIIGPNGSGKSNLMDALSFVLGIQAKHLRGARLTDLVYRREEERLADLDRKAMVMIVFVMPDGKRRMHVARVISTKGESQYKFGVGNPPKLKNIDFEKLQNELKTVNIFVRARNFLVFQGDVMDLARRQGLELTRIIETISGSDMHKLPMEKLDAEQRIAEEQQRIFFANKRQTDQQRSELERQKVDLEKYYSLKAEAVRVKLEGCMFDLYAQEVQIEAARQESEKMLASVHEKTAVYEEKSKAFESLLGSRKKLNAQVVQFENAFRKLQADANERRCEKETLARQQHGFAKNVRDVIAKRDEIVSGLSQKQSLVEAMKADLGEAKKALVATKEEIKENEEDIFTKDQRKLWNQAETRARAVNRQKKRELDDQNEHLAELLSTRKDNDRKRAELQVHHEELRKRLLLNQRHADIQSKDVDAIKGAVASEEEQLAATESEIAELEKVLESFVVEKTEVDKSLAVMQEQRQALSASRTQKDIISELKKKFSGVMERVNELIIPTSAASSNALSAALGGNQQYVVCDTVKTAKQCVAHLKKNKREQLTFLPLDSVRSNVIKGLHVLARKEGRKLAIEICKPNPSFFASDGGKVFEPTMRQITETILNATLGDCVVCENLEDARAIAYRESRKQNLRCRVVTLDGDMIRMNGNMVSADNRKVNFGQKTGQQDLLKLREAAKGINDDIQETTATIAELRRKADPLRMKIKADKETIRTDGGRSKNNAQILKKDEESLKKIVKELELLDAAVAASDVKIGKQEAAVAATEKKLLELGKHFYDEISKQMNVPNIRELIADRKKAAAAKHEEANEIEELVIKIQTDIMRTRSYVKDDLAQEKRLGQELKKKEQMLADTQSKFEKLELSVEKLETELADKRKEHRDAKSELEVSENKLKELKCDTQKAKAEMVHAQNLEKKLNKVRSISHAKYKTLEAAHMDGVQIPVLECPLQLQESEGIMGGQLWEVERSPQEIVEVLGTLTIDYAILSDETKEMAATSSEDSRKDIKKQYINAVEHVQKQIEALPQSLNLNAQQEYAELCAKFRDQTAEAEEMVKASQELQRQYEKVRDERYEMFMGCFRLIEKEVDPIYKELTSFDGREGGSAFLDLEFPDLPFSGGTLFTACPPGKRFFDMSLLSGGEKSMASMALLLAMHSHNPPPFMILDEVDAPFDRKNTDCLVKFLRKMPFQSIVISLKDKFFCYADACVGIFKDKCLQTSGHITIQLDDASDDESPPVAVPENTRKRPTPSKPKNAKKRAVGKK